MRMSRKGRHRLEEAARLEEEGRKRWEPVAFRMSRKRRKRLAMAQDGEEPRLKRFVLQNLRMTRSRKRKMREDAALRQTAQAASISALALLPAAASEAAGISNVLNDIPAVFDSLRNERNRIRDFHAAIRNAKEAAAALIQAEQDLQMARQDQESAEKGLAEAQQSLEKAQTNLRRISQELASASLESAQRTREAIAAQQAVADFAPKVWAQEAALQSVRGQQQSVQATYEQLGRELGYLRDERDDLEERIRKAWESVDYAQNRLNDVMAMVNRVQAAIPEQSAKEAQWQEYDRELAALDSEVDSAEALLDDLNSQLDALQDAREAAEDAERDARELVKDLQEQQADGQQDLQDSENYVAETEKWNEEAARGVETAEANLAATQDWKLKADYELAHFGEGKGLSTGFEYYSWQGGRLKGYQVYQPIEFYASEKKWDFSLATGWISSNTGLPKGHINGWTDTTVGITYKNDHKVNDMHYKLSINVPTGKDNVHQNAMMADNLARFNSFNEGWQFTPEIEAVHRFTERDSLFGRIRYSFCRNYGYRIEYYDTGIYDSDTWLEVDPHGKFQQEAEYRHIGEKQQFSAQLTHINANVSYYSTGYGNGRYEDGEDWTLQIYGSQDIDEKNSWQYYARGNYQAADTGGVHRYYGGLGWTHQFDKVQRGYIMFNYGETHGQSYNLRTGNLISGRILKAVVIGYDCRLNDTSELRAKLEGYNIAGSAEDSYHGCKMSLMWNKSF